MTMNVGQYVGYKPKMDFGYTAFPLSDDLEGEVCEVKFSQWADRQAICLIFFMWKEKYPDIKYTKAQPIVYLVVGDLEEEILEDQASENVELKHVDRTLA